MRGEEVEGQRWDVCLCVFFSFFIFFFFVWLGPSSLVLMWMCVVVVV